MKKAKINVRTAQITTVWKFVIPNLDKIQPFSMAVSYTHLENDEEFEAVVAEFDKIMAEEA